MLETGNKTTDSLIGVRFTGNVIHQNWYKTILMDNGKPDAISIMILADIVYWYRHSEIRDEITGRTIGFSKKFKSDLLQRTYESFSEQMGFTKRQVQESIKRLEAIGVITRIFRTVKFGDLVCYNVLYIKLNFDDLMTITFGEILPHIIMSHPTQEEAPTLALERGTNTKTLTHNSTKIKATTNSPVKTIVASIFKADEDLPPGIKASLFSKLVVRHGLDAVQKQLRNLKAVQNQKIVKNPAGWLTAAVDEEFDSKIEVDLFSVHENKQLEKRLIEKLNDDSNVVTELKDQDFKAMLGQRPRWFLDILTGINA